MDKKSIVIEYARSYNNLDIKYIYPYLAEDVKYNAQDRICELNGVNQVSKHLKRIQLYVSYGIWLTSPILVSYSSVAA